MNRLRIQPVYGVALGLLLVGWGDRPTSSFSHVVLQNQASPVSSIPPSPQLDDDASLSPEDAQNAFGELVADLGQRCTPDIGATYQSQQLRSPDQSMTVYFDGVLQKTLVPDSPLRDLDSPEYCYADQRTTPEQALMIQQANQLTRVDLGEYTDGYVVTNPVSFSPDGRYLIAAVAVAYTGGDPGSYSAIFDLTRQDSLQFSPPICNEADFEHYVGFITPTDVAFQCTIYGDLESWFEVVNLETRARSPLATAPDPLHHYGAIHSPFQYRVAPNRSERPQ